MLGKSPCCQVSGLPQEKEWKEYIYIFLRQNNGLFKHPMFVKKRHFRNAIAPSVSRTTTATTNFTGASSPVLQRSANRSPGSSVWMWGKTSLPPSATPISTKLHARSSSGGRAPAPPFAVPAAAQGWKQQVRGRQPRPFQTGVNAWLKSRP